MICHQRLSRLTKPIIPWSQRFSFTFLRMRELRESRVAVNSSRGAAIKKNVWLPWTWISLSCRRQGQDLTLGLGLVDILQTSKSIWLVRLIFNTEGMVGISVTALLKVNFAYLYQRKNLFAKYFSSQFIHVQDSSVLLTVSSKEFWPRYSRSVFQRLKVSPNIEVLLAVIIAKMCCHTPNQKWKVNYNSVDPGRRQIPVPDKLFIPSPCHNFGCVSSEVSGGASCETVAFSADSLSSQESA